MARSTLIKELRPLKGIREEDLDAVFGGGHRHCGAQHFGNEHSGHQRFGNQQFGNQQFGENIVQTNIAIEIAIALGGNVTQLIDQSNVV
jgi:hypothetical protein